MISIDCKSTLFTLFMRSDFIGQLIFNFSSQCTNCLSRHLHFFNTGIPPFYNIFFVFQIQSLSGSAGQFISRLDC